MSPYEVLLSESQERMLIVVRAGREADVQAVFARYELHAVAIGTVIAEPVVRCRAGGEPVCELPGTALADGAPRYLRPAAPPPDLEARRGEDLRRLAAEAPRVETLVELLGAPNLVDRKPIWRRYDHMNGTNTVVGPGGDAALLRLKGTGRALAVAIDGPGPARLGDLDPRLAGASAVVEGALNVASGGAVPLGVTDCLNLGSPETPTGAWQLAEVVDGIADACRAIGLPVVSGNVSLYNETPDGPILPTPVVGTLGLIEDRARAVRLGWTAGDEVWLLGAPAWDADALAASELAWRRGERGGRPSLDLTAAARLVGLLPRLAADGLLAGAHDVSIGGLGVALARLAIAAGVGAEIDLPAEANRTPTAALFGERGGRVIVACRPTDATRLAAAAESAGVVALRLGRVGGDDLVVRMAGGELRAAIDALGAAWRAPIAPAA